jgi:predicted regulator of Ras-like GTPase activity (Roadblock/LC7/MglB family)
MSQNVRSILSALRDVDGIQGSFAVSKSGALLAKDLPAVFDDGLFAVVGPRIARLHETLALGGAGLTSIVMRFSEHKLHLRPTEFGFLAVLSDLGTNMSALKMALTLVARRLQPELFEGTQNDGWNGDTTESPGEVSDARHSTLPSADFAPLLPNEVEAKPRAFGAASARPAITYRGRRIE